MTDEYLWRLQFITECEALKNENLINDDVYSRLTNVVLKVSAPKKRGRRQVYLTKEEKAQANREYGRKHYHKKKLEREHPKS
jgi:hypothetical protein